MVSRYGDSMSQMMGMMQARMQMQQQPQQQANTLADQLAGMLGGAPVAGLRVLQSIQPPRRQPSPR
jgi:hypothetical protein